MEKLSKFSKSLIENSKNIWGGNGCWTKVEHNSNDPCEDTTFEYDDEA